MAKFTWGPVEFEKAPIQMTFKRDSDFRNEYTCEYITETYTAIPESGCLAKSTLKIRTLPEKFRLEIAKNGENVIRFEPISKQQKKRGGHNGRI